MRPPASYSGLETLGRVRLGQHFFMRDFLYSEIGNFHAVPNIPDTPDLAIAAGRGLCKHLLDPMTNTFGPLHIRSAYRSPTLNHFGATQAKPQRCSANEKNYAGHIWDIRDKDGHMGACVSVVIPWFTDQYEQGRDWRDLAWWIHDHLPYSAMYFFPKLAAFNLTWHENPARSIHSYVAPKGTLLAAGATPDEDTATRAARYADFPELGGIAYPEPSSSWQIQLNPGGQTEGRSQ
ncbi:hypothetical protein [Pseudooctadecabacter jejudonensis]|uniref:Peptidase M15 n=1 Tax=Pseudooctadecabacter jejudonensis TaxID=1391910 RepID=A0A1Y5SGX5_9RHOB|nr:hypothetical protein [Pseudooctadecabacter jejudonensis]SLN40451.1 hypothetical protein PSJ8397_02010 [Pseudooctadecabacter jejudonensis]